MREEAIWEKNGLPRTLLRARNDERSELLCQAMETLKSMLVALIACLFCLQLLKPLAIRIGLVDRPDDRKRHSNNVPLIGGIAIFFGFCFSLLSLPISLFPYRGLLAGASLLVFIGVLDDFHNISSRVRLLGQLIASLLLIIWSHALISQTGNLFFTGNLQLGLWAMPISVLIIMANINAMNMVDGQDGLAGVVALGQAFLLGYLCYHFGRINDLHLLIILVVLLACFLAFNMRFPWRKYATIFLGDAGSTLIAFILAWFALRISQTNLSLLKPIIILWIMSFPIFDLINVVIHRALNGQSVFKAGRDHFHHVLQLAGISTGLSTLALGLFSFALGLLGFVLNAIQLREAWQFVLWIVVLVCYLSIVSFSRSRYSRVC